MCEKKKYCSREIDYCIYSDVEEINLGFFDNSHGKFRTLSSCCGHGKYPITIVVENTLNGRIFEWFTGVDFPKKYKNGKKNKRFYKKDSDGLYYIPEVMTLSEA